jgi:hypothetical protein
MFRISRYYSRHRKYGSIITRRQRFKDNWLYWILFLRKRSVRNRELLQLLGNFNFAARVVLPGRSFVTYIINISTNVSRLYHYIKLSQECIEDLHMWLLFFKQWNHVSLFYESKLTHASNLELYTDVASNFGFWGKWLSDSLPPELKNIL